MRIPLYGWLIVVFVAALSVGGFVALRGSPTQPPPIAPEIPTYPVVKILGRSVEGREITAYTYGSGPRHLVFVGVLERRFEV